MKTNMNINIDTEKLSEQITKFEEVNNKLKEEFEKDLNNNTNLKEYWDSKNATSVYEDFDDFKTSTESYISKNEEYIEYLKNIVKEGYIDFEDEANEEIDKKISVDWSA